MKNTRVDIASEILEIEILGDRAWMRGHLRVVLTPHGAAPKVRSGSTLAILSRQADGAWAVARDANLLTSEPSL